MSAFVVEDRTINRIVAFLAQGANEDAAKPLVRLGYKIQANGNGGRVAQHREKERLAKALFEMNCRAVDARYADHPARTKFHPEEFVFLTEAPPGAIEAIKRMGCLGYQCLEGDVPEEDLYKALRESQKLVALGYVCDSPEYDGAGGWE